MEVWSVETLFLPYNNSHDFELHTELYSTKYKAEVRVKELIREQLYQLGMMTGVEQLAADRTNIVNWYKNFVENEEADLFSINIDYPNGDLYVIFISLETVE